MKNFCPNCGYGITNTTKFCSNCGHHLEEQQLPDFFTLEKYLNQNLADEKGVINCPFCLGKGSIDNGDVERLKNIELVNVGDCNFCEGVGRVNVNKIKNYQNLNKIGSTLDSGTEQNSIQLTQTNLDDGDKLGSGLKVLSFCLPIIGVILYFTNKDKNPKTAKSACYSSLWGWGLAIIISIIFFLFTMGAIGSSVYDNLNEYEHNQNLDTSSTTLDSTNVSGNTNESETLQDVNYQLGIMDSKSKSYNCRHCGKAIPWIGSYYWTTYRDENGTLKTDFSELEDLQYAGDERIDTPSYSEENTISRGVFCTYDCAYKNSKNYTENNEFPY